jgi:hypothetical protein
VNQQQTERNKQKMEIAIIWIAVCGLVGGMIGKSKGQTAGGVVAGIMLGPVGWLIVALVRPVGQRKCPYCAEQVKQEATVCRFCSRDLPPLPKPVSNPVATISLRTRVIQVCAIMAVVALIIGLIGAFIKASKETPAEQWQIPVQKSVQSYNNGYTPMAQRANQVETSQRYNPMMKSYETVRQ